MGMTNRTSMYSYLTTTSCYRLRYIGKSIRHRMSSWIIMLPSGDGMNGNESPPRLPSYDWDELRLGDGILHRCRPQKTWQSLYHSCSV